MDVKKIRPPAESDVAAIDVGHQFLKTVLADALTDGAADATGQIQLAVRKSAGPAPARSNVVLVARRANRSALEHHKLGPWRALQNLQSRKHPSRPSPDNGKVEFVRYRHKPKISYAQERQIAIIGGHVLPLAFTRSEER